MNTPNTSNRVSVRRAGRPDRGVVVATVVAAFVRDPAFRFFFPDDAAYPQQAAAFVGYLFDKRLRDATVWMHGDGSAVALWSPPGTNPHRDAPPDVLRLRAAMIDAIGPDAAGRLGEYDAAVSGALPTAEAYWYLGVLACLPARAGSGLGSAVMRVGMGEARSQGTPAYLETTNPANVGYYERAGWRVTATIPDALPVSVWVLRAD